MTVLDDEAPIGSTPAKLGSNSPMVVNIASKYLHDPNVNGD